MARLQKIRDALSDVKQSVGSSVKPFVTRLRTRSMEGDLVYSYTSSTSMFVSESKISRGFARFFAAIFESPILKHKLGKLLSTEHGKLALKDFIMDSASRRLNLSDVEKKNLEAKIDLALKNGDLKGVFEEVKRIAEVKTGNAKEAKNIFKQIEADVGVRALKGVVFGKDGAVFDAVSEKLYVKGSAEQLNLDPSDPKEYQRSINLLKQHGIEASGKRYAKIVLGKLVAEAILGSNSAEEARSKFEKALQDRLNKDDEFRRGFEKVAEEELMKSYNAGVLFKQFEEFAKKMPSFVAGAIARMLAHAVRRLPILGDVAAVQYEVAASLAEVGEKLSDKVESSAVMPNSIRNELSQTSTVQNIIARIIQQQQQQHMAQQAGQIQQGAVNTPLQGGGQRP